MGIFDPITDALSGKPQAAKPASQPTGGKRATGGDFSGLADARNREMCENGQNPQDYGINYNCTPGTTSGLDAALQQHADKLHPVKK